MLWSSVCKLSNSAVWDGEEGAMLASRKLWANQHRSFNWEFFLYTGMKGWKVMKPARIELGCWLAVVPGSLLQWPLQ